MHSFLFMNRLIARSFTGRGLLGDIAWLGLRAPGNVVGMYLRGESPEYIVQACLACQQIGE